MEDRSKKVLIVGAGGAGLACAKNLKAVGIDFDLVDSEPQAGGMWASGIGIYDSLHLNTSRNVSGFPDFPMPENFPLYPSAKQVADYLRRYAEHFLLEIGIEFNLKVEKMEKSGNAWDVRFGGGIARRYGSVVVSSGFYRRPRFPSYAEDFRGEVIHSVNYRRPDEFKGKHVLVVGGGSSGCEIAAEIARANPGRTFWSVRRGYYIFPRFLCGKPTDQFAVESSRRPSPFWLQRWIYGLLLKIVVGNPQDRGLPKPDHRLLEAHPAIGTQALDEIAFGRLAVVGDIERIEGKRVSFKSAPGTGLDLPFEAIVFCTGFRKEVAFLSPDHLVWNSDEGRPGFYGHIFHPKYSNLFIVGNFETAAASWPFLDLQAKAVASYLQARSRGSRSAAKFERDKHGRKLNLSRGISFLKTERHALEVEATTYRRWLLRTISKLRSG